jgi:subtilase family serine protease
VKQCIALLVLAVIAATSTITGNLQISHAEAPQVHTHRICGNAPAGYAHCNAILVESGGGLINQSRLPGLTPDDLQAAYNLPSRRAGNDQTIAIIDAHDNPNAERDLAVYRARFGLPACTSANGCFKKVDQNGGTNYPTADPAWTEEIALDLDMVSAICPHCKIILIEASTAAFANLGVAVETAVRLGANVISNSYGGEEFADEAKYAHFYNQPGVVITASSGDSGYRVEVPAAYNTVVSVGGTTLSRARNSRGWNESVWGGAGSGCSRFISKPAWQHDKGCTNRTVADVAAVADPRTGVTVYNSYGPHAGWITVGGTSVSAPIIAGVYALAGRAGTHSAARSLYFAHSNSLYDVTRGSNGSCQLRYLCTGSRRYDGPTGLGTPHGIRAF